MEWITAVGEPGPECLTPDEVAAVLGGGEVPPHAAACPRCAAELADLRPPKRRVRLSRFERPSSRAVWVAAAAAAALLVAAIIGVSVRPKKAPESPVVRAPEIPVPPPPAVPPPEPPQPPPAVPETVPVPAVKPPEVKPVAPPVEPPRVEPEPRPVPPAPKPETPTLVEPPARAEAALSLKAGGLLAQEGGRWQKPDRILEGVPLRADGKARLEFAQAQVSLESAARFSVEREEFTLLDGGISAQVPPRSSFVLRLGTFRIVPQAAVSRVLLSAASGKVVVDEGTARSGDVTLAEGVEHEAKGDRLEPRKGRTVPFAARSRETLTWRLDLANRNATRGKLQRGVLQATPFGPALASTPSADPSTSGGIHYTWGGETETFVLKPTTAFRFRYFLKQPMPVEFVARNRTRDESFGARLDPVAGAWTTVTLRVLDIPVKTGGRDVIAEVGDHYGWFGWNLGRTSVPGDFMVDRVEVLEIEP
jgi:hypothetical protein